MERTAPSLTGRGFARPRNLTPRSSEALVRRPAANAGEPTSKRMSPEGCNAS
ncbi:hypothetical protein H7972_32430, partial [Pseudomonas aeruginosa]|nr:hypothetical protein [Pseudomonas aeruginosa]